MTRLIRLTILVLAASASSALGQREPSFTDVCHERVEAALDDLAASGDAGKARERLEEIFDLVIAYADTRDPSVFVETAWAVRLAGQLEKLEASERAGLLEFLRENPRLGQTLVLLIREEDDTAGVFRVLRTLRDEFGAKVAQYPDLTAAICVVHDQPLSYKVNENTAKADPPERIFEYFVRNERRLAHPIKSMPAVLLRFVVDTTASVPEMQWALDKYKNDKRIGQRFFDIRYDRMHFLEGTPKQVTQQGFNLPNILQYGGVCADQAYFAVSVAKAQGIPSAYTRARGGSGGHAWVGFLDTRGRRAWWDFDNGRYDTYKGLRGDVITSQTGQRVSDASVSLMSMLIAVREQDRHAAVAFSDAADRLAVIRGDSKRAATYPPSSDELPVRGRLRNNTSRAVSVDSELDLIEAGLRRCAGYERGWVQVAVMSQKEELTLAHKRHWADALMRMCGKNYPDFTLSLLAAMVVTVEDEKEQNRLWNALFDLCGDRPDLAAQVRLAQGDMWLAQDDKSKAWSCYEDAAQRYINDGPFAITALDRCEKMLRDNDQLGHIVPMYERAWREVDRPDAALNFTRSSNFNMVAVRYIKALNAEGRQNESAIVQRALEGR